MRKSNLHKKYLQEARKEFASQGYKAMRKKYSKRQIQEWRKKGGEATRKKFKNK